MFNIYSDVFFIRSSIFPKFVQEFFSERNYTPYVYYEYFYEFPRYVLSSQFLFVSFSIRILLIVHRRKRD